MSFRWGIFGTGTISAKFVAGLAAANDAQAVMVASRSAESARAFAGAFGIAEARAGYAEAAAAGGVDAVYIATPPALHAEHARLCLEAGIPVLVEKPFATSVAEAEAISDAASSSGVFAMEAMWTRFLPAAQALKERIAAGGAGEVRLLAGSFGGSAVPEPTNANFDPARGGGALAQLGVYPVSLAHWLMGPPTEVEAMGTIGATGVDEDVAMTLRFAGGAIGSFFASLRAPAPNDFRVMGTEAMIATRGPIFRPYGLLTHAERPKRRGGPDYSFKAKLREHGAVQWLVQLAGISSRRGGRFESFRYSGNGYHYEADEVARCVRAGARESTIMPLAESIAVAKTLGRIKSSLHPRAKELP